MFRSVVSKGVPVDMSNLSLLGEEDLYWGIASEVYFTGYGDAIEVEFVIADITFKNKDFLSEGSLAHLTTLDLFPTNITTSHN